MAPNMLQTGQIGVVPSGFLGLRYEFRSPEGTLGVLSHSAFRVEGRFRDADGREFRMRRSHRRRRNYELRTDDTVVATAQGRTSKQVALDVEFGGEPYLLEEVDFWSVKWRLLGPAGTAVLEIRQRGILRLGLVIDVLAPVAVELMAFAIYLMVTAARERIEAIAEAMSAIL